MFDIIIKNTCYTKESFDFLEKNFKESIYDFITKEVKLKNYHYILAILIDTGYDTLVKFNDTQQFSPINLNYTLHILTKDGCVHNFKGIKSYFSPTRMYDWCVTGYRYVIGQPNYSYYVNINYGDKNKYGEVKFSSHGNGMSDYELKVVDPTFVSIHNCSFKNVSNDYLNILKQLMKKIYNHFDSNRKTKEGKLIDIDYMISILNKFMNSKDDFMIDYLIEQRSFINKVDKNVQTIDLQTLTNDLEKTVDKYTIVLNENAILTKKYFEIKTEHEKNKLTNLTGKNSLISHMKEYISNLNNNIDIDINILNKKKDITNLQSLKKTIYDENTRLTDESKLCIDTNNKNKNELSQLTEEIQKINDEINTLKLNIEACNKDYDNLKFIDAKIKLSDIELDNKLKVIKKETIEKYGDSLIDIIPELK